MDGPATPPRALRAARACASALFAAAVIAGAPTGGRAQGVERADPARLRAGEHPGFSRVALDVPALEDWRLERDGRNLTIVFPGRALDFDTRQIAPERRVTRVTAARTEARDDGTNLILSLACPCEATAFEFRSGMLVIDIRPEADTPAETPQAPPADDTASVPPIANAPAATPGAPTRVQPTENRDAISVEEAQSRLLEQLARAADQGLIAFREPAAGPAEPAAPPPPEVEAAPAAAEPSPPVIPAPQPVAAQDREAPQADTVQLSARTAYDPPPTPVAPPQAACPDPDDLDIAAWAGDEDFHAELSRRRGALVAEFDRPSAATGVALARLYLRFGFGREARQVLRTFAPEAPETALLIDLAAVADGEPASADGPLAAAGDCTGRVALWRIAGGFPPSPEATSDPEWRDDVLAAFGDLPVDLRRRSGPALVEALVEAGQLSAAEAARRLLDRAPGDHGDLWRLASARLARATGEGEAAERLLTAVARSGGLAAPEAMLALADLLTARGAQTPAWLVEDIALAAFRHQGTQLGRRLLTAEVLAQAGRNQLGTALDLLASQLVAGRAAAEDVDAARRTILAAAGAAGPGAAAYAEAVLDHAPSYGDGPDWDAARIRIASELTGLGLANAAAELLAPALARGGPAARLTAARIALGLGDPEAAHRHLQDMPGAEAALLRADALEAAGRHVDAWREAAPHLPADSVERAERAWRGGDWSAAAALPTDDPRRDLADWMAGRGAAAEPLPSSTEPPSLSRAQSAIDDARNARTLIERALEDG